MIQYSKQTTVQQEEYLLNNQQKKALVILIFFIIAPYILLENNFQTGFSLYIVILTICMLYFNRITIKKNITTFLTNRKRVNNLNYYFFNDIFKSIDRQKRISNISILNNIGIISYVVGVLFISSLTSLLNQLFGKSSIIEIFTLICILFLLLFLLWGWLTSMAFKYTTLFYCCIPFIAYIIYILFEVKLTGIPTSLKLCLFLIISASIYLLFTIALPLHILRKLNSKTVIISALLTVFTTLMIQSSPLLTELLLKNEQLFLTKEMIQKDSAFSNEIKAFLMNEDIIRLINHFIRKEYVSEFSGILSLISTGVTLSFLFGGLFVTLRLSRAKSSAKKILYTSLFNNNDVSYETLIECAYKGGDEYEHIILSNTKYLEVIKQYEAPVVLPQKTSYRDRLKFSFKEKYVTKF